MSSTKRKAPPVRFARPQTTQSAKPLIKPRVNDNKMSVVPVAKQGKTKKTEAIEISSDEGEDNDDDDVDDEADAEEDAVMEEAQTNGNSKENSTGDADADADDDNDDAAEPTFGDLVREHGTVDVAAALGTAVAPGADAATAKTGAAAVPTLASLGHLLNAALRSGDDANLEVCFNTTTSTADAAWVRNTVQRLDPSLAGVLLQKLAARIHRRPGRAHTLIGWVQWTLITHGGALLANQPGVTGALQELHRVLEERARGLNSLLLLKGKLDMLEAQMQLRRLQRAGGAGVSSGALTAVGHVGSRAVDSASGAIGSGRRGRRRGNNAGAAHARGGDEADDDDVVTYREGRDDEDSDGADDDENEAAGQILVNGAAVAGESFIADSDEEEALDEDDDASEDGEDDDEGDDDDDEELEEDEDAEVDEVDFDDVDDEDDDDDDEDDDVAAAAAPPAKLQKKAGGAFSKRR